MVADLTGLESPQPGLTLRRIAWLINAPLTQTYPLILKILAEIHRLLNFNSSLDVVFWSVLIVGSYSLARITNLVKAIKNSFRQQALKRPLVVQPNSPLCPVQAYKLMLEVIPVQKISQTWYYCQRGVKYPSLTHVLKNASKSLVNRQEKTQNSIHHTPWGMEGQPLPSWPEDHSMLSKCKGTGLLTHICSISNYCLREARASRESIIIPHPHFSRSQLTGV